MKQLYSNNDVLKKNLVIKKKINKRNAGMTNSSHLLASWFLLEIVFKVKGCNRYVIEATRNNKENISVCKENKMCVFSKRKYRKGNAFC